MITYIQNVKMFHNLFVILAIHKFCYFNLSVSVGVSTPGVPKPTSKLSLRVPAQMGRREMEHKGEKRTAARVILRPGRMRLQ
jgi:hypothetical protein